MYYNVTKTASIVKELRKEKMYLTQEIIAEQIGINIKTYQSIEQGVRGISIDTLCLVANYFKVSLDYLITGEKEDAEWNVLTINLSKEQRKQLFSITSNMIMTLGWM
ncbi:MAG: helix-turn-helix transcriptional regulator [Mobilitalea sp.]